MHIETNIKLRELQINKRIYYIDKMKNKAKKNKQIECAKYNLNYFFKLLDERFYPKYDKFYIKEIKSISQSFNIRLTREQKLKFCKRCNTYQDIDTRDVRINPKTKTINYICKICNYARRFRYK